MAENDKKREAGVALHTCDKSRYPPLREAGVALSRPLKGLLYRLQALILTKIVVFEEEVWVGPPPRANPPGHATPPP